MFVARRIAALVLLLGITPVLVAQAPPPPKVGPEFDVLKKQVGTWDTVMKAGGMETKGVATYKMDLNGLWLAGTFDTDLGGQKYSGRGFDSYDEKKKKYVGVWMDSMGTSPMVMEGTYDDKSKALTMIGDGPDMTGKTTKWKSVSTWGDADTLNFSMFVGDGKEPMFSIVYKRKK